MPPGVAWAPCPAASASSAALAAASSFLAVPATPAALMAALIGESCTCLEKYVHQWVGSNDQNREGIETATSTNAKQYVDLCHYEMPRSMLTMCLQQPWTFTHKCVRRHKTCMNIVMHTVCLVCPSIINIKPSTFKVQPNFRTLQHVTTALASHSKHIWHGNNTVAWTLECHRVKVGAWTQRATRNSTR